MQKANQIEVRAYKARRLEFLSEEAQKGWVYLFQAALLSELSLPGSQACLRVSLSSLSC